MGRPAPIFMADPVNVCIPLNGESFFQLTGIDAGDLVNSNQLTHCMFAAHDDGIFHSAGKHHIRYRIFIN